MVQVQYSPPYEGSSISRISVSKTEDIGAIPILHAKKGNDNMQRKYTPHELWDIYMRGKPPKKKETRLQKAIRKARTWAVHLKTLVTRE